jgi:ATP-dependent DNA helicase PIF1
MVHSDVADSVERTLRDVMQNDRDFGGKAVLFMGDFKQLLPVVRFGAGHNCTIQKCRWWQSVRFLKFTKNWRAADNPEYTAFLEDIGNGRIDFAEPPQASQVTSYADLIEAVYGNEWHSAHQILALTLETCGVVNDLCFGKLPGALIRMPASDQYVDCRDPDDFPHDYIESLDMKDALPWMLHFKVGAKYMYIRNLDVKRGVVNGTMLMLVSVGRHTAQFEILTGKARGCVDIFTPAVFTITPEASGLLFTIIRKQYPIIPAYCLSVHKAQGHSLLRVGLIFESDPFTHGQLYVALSRVAGWHRVYAMYLGENIKNHVLRHLLLSDPQSPHRLEP